MKIKLLWALLIIILASTIIMINYGPHEPSKLNKSKNEQSQFKKENSITLTTNASSYAPGEEVILNGKMKNRHYKGHIKVEFYHLHDKFYEEIYQVKNGRFSQKILLPKEDFKGYMIKVMTLAKPAVTGSIAVDVSSDWSRFPRYGFLSEFGDKPVNEINAQLSELNRFHINGLQFYDFHYKHHQPIKMKGGLPAEHWKDIANRRVSLKTVETYVERAHQMNMKAMAYNLINGTFEGAEREGVNPDWYLYRDQTRSTIDTHALPDNWKSNVLLTNITHPDWQQYIIHQQENVYKQLNFDGWHIDQLGNRGEVFNEHGDEIQLDQAFGSFLKTIKYQDQPKRIVMNAVNQYGQEQIAKSPVEFLYTEVWDEYKEYGDLKRIIDDNTKASNQTKNTVLAAYMNYSLSEQEGSFNEAGILLTNSVIFAAGGSHIELGDHMLSKEYFPHNNLKVSHSLKRKLTAYYDFLVAYQNVLRDNNTSENTQIHSNSGVSLSSSAEQGKVWTISKGKESHKVLHFINFTKANSMEWRDSYGTQKQPDKLRNIEIVVKDKETPRKIWMASPDTNYSLPQELPFSYKNGEISFSLPSLEYWDMVVMEM